MAQVQNPHPITKLSQLNKPTNHPKRKTRNKTSTLPTKQNNTPSPSILNKTKVQQNTQHSNETNKNPVDMAFFRYASLHPCAHHARGFYRLKYFSNSHNNPYTLWAQTTNTTN